MTAPFAGWLVEALIASTLLMIAVLIVRAAVRRAFGPGVAYALWALPVLRLLLPPLPDAWRLPGAWGLPDAWGPTAPISRVGDQVTFLVIDAPTSAADPSSTDIAALLLASWAIGAAVFLLWHLVDHVRFRRRLLADPVALAERDGVRVIASAAAPGPLAFGILRRYVAFPRDADQRYDQAERELALAHELGHHARGDLVANWAALAVLALHWWNPVAWRAFRAFRADQELANDARVLAGRDPADRVAYARAILKSAHGHAVSPACHLHTIADLKGRLRMLTTSRPSRTRLAGGIAATAILTIAGLGLTASGSRAAEAVTAVTASVGDTIGVDLGQVPPAPPIPPVPPTPVPGGASDTVTTTTTDGKTTRTRVIRMKNGERSVDLSGIPEVSERNCTEDGAPSEVVINRREGGKQRIIICTNRIEKLAADGAATAANSKDIERNALTAALSGLRSARDGMLAGRGMDDAGNRQAIPAIEEAIAEVEADLAKLG